MKINKITKIFSIITVFCIILAICVKVVIGATTTYTSVAQLMAARESAVGGRIKLAGYEDEGTATDYMETSPYIYCAQYKMNTGVADYEVSYYVDLKGYTATSYDANGNTKTYSDVANKNLAYILTSGYNGATTTKNGYTVADISNSVYGHGSGAGGNSNQKQRALWFLISHDAYPIGTDNTKDNTWYNVVGKKIGIDWQDETNDLRDQYYTYNGTRYNEGERVYGDRSGNNPTGNVADSTKKLYDAALASTNAASYIENINENVTTSNNVAGPFKVKYAGTISEVNIKDNAGNIITNGLSYYTDANCTNQIQPNGIQSEQNFYIKNDSGKIIKNVEIKLAEVNTLCARMWFLKSTTTGKQRQIIAEPYLEPEQKSIDIPVTINEKLTIQKVNEDKTIKLAAGFKVKTSEGWLKSISGGYEYNSNFNEATEFRTTENTDVVIEGLKIGEYEVYETKAPEGYVLKMQDNYLPEDNTAGERVLVSAINISKSKQITLIQPNKLIGNLTIIKKDATTGANLTGAKFKIKVGTSGDNWLKGTNGSYSYNNSYANASEYAVNNGVLEIKGLKYETYTIYETYAPADTETGNYFRAAQPNYDSTNKWVSFGTDGVVTIDGNNLDVTANLRNIPTGNLTITKVDKNSKQTITDEAQFKLYNNATSKWVSGSNGNFNYNQTFENAEAYKTVNGVVTIKGLSKNVEFTIFEVKAPNGYSLGGQDNYLAADSNAGERVQIGTVKIGDTEKEISYTAENRKSGEITIFKSDKTNNTALTGASFKVYSVSDNGWISKTGNSWKYDNTFDNGAEEFTVNSEGKVSIQGIKYGTYRIYEVKSPTGYDLTTQDGYTENDNQTGAKKAVFSKEVTLNESNNGTVTVSISNEKTISITGFVWEDEIIGKDNINDKIYNETEKKIPGVTVYLKDRRETDNSKYIQRVTTDENGNYTLNNLVPNNLTYYYVEFDYSTAESGKYKRYIPVTFNADDSNIENTSKALKSDLINGAYPVKDSELTGKATTYKGIPEGEDAQNLYGLQEGGTLYTKLYNQDTSTLQYINLGIQPTKDSEYRIEQEIAYAKINFKGYGHKYNYNGIEDRTLSNTPLVNWQAGHAYSRDVYPSDIAANIKDPDSLKVYVVYKIMIKNTVNFDVPDIYTEKQLIINSLNEEIDSKYELSTDIDERLDDNVVKNDIGKWNATSNLATYTGNKIRIDSGKQQSVYIQFKVKNEEVNKLMQRDATTLVTAITKGYHEYTRNDNGWFNNSIKELGNHETEEQEARAEAPGMRFKLPDDNKERIITGKVFKDNVTNEKKANKEFIGNGQYDSDEATVEKVNVQLYEKDGTTVATRYPKNSETSTSETTQAVETTVGGNYTLSGVTPGEYIIRFTYGDGTTYDVKDYKSTIIALESAENALKNQNNTHGSEWYKYKGSGNDLIDKNNYSVAVDNLETREKINEGEDIRKIDSDTPVSAITIENTPTNITNANDGNNPAFDGFNLGIIEQPKQTAELEKVITNVRLTTGMNNVIFDGNPETTANMTGVSDLDGITNEGSTYTRVEIAEELIYGSTLELTYELRIKNTSDTVYVETDEQHYGWYYLYGEHGSYSRKVRLSIDEMIDYLDPSLAYKETITEGVSVKVISQTIVGGTWADKDNNNYEISNSSLNLIQDKTDRKYKEVLAITGIGDVPQGDTARISISASKELSNEDSDLEYLNDIKIEKMSTTIENMPTEESQKELIEKSLKLVRKPVIPEQAEATITITPPTGKDKQMMTIYVITGISSLIILAVGIILIKKKIA